MIDGFGTLILSDGSSYIGEWKEDKINGQGKYTFLNGNEYDVFNEISYRFENSEIPAELEEMGINKGDLIKLNNSEFEYEK